MTEAEIIQVWNSPGQEHRLAHLGRNGRVSCAYFRMGGFIRRDGAPEVEIRDVIERVDFTLHIETETLPHPQCAWEPRTFFKIIGSCGGVSVEVDGGIAPGSGR